MPLDLLLVNPGNRSLIYQGLGDSLTAVEPPMWCRLIAGYVRDRGYGVAIHDYDAGEPFPAADDVRLIAIVAFGHQPSASTQQMADIGKLILGVKSSHPGAKVILVGGHVSALTRRTMEEEPCDYACTGEGPETILGLLEGKPEEEIPGLAWRDGGEIVINAPAKKIADLDADLHGNTWDLLPMQAYRAHSWQVMDGSPRQPYASIYSSLGCPHRCNFCMINVMFGGPSYRMRSPQAVVDEVRMLYETYGVRTFKFCDELFLVKPSHYLPIVEALAEFPFASELNLWCYGRPDSVKIDTLPLLRRAGIRWIALGIESGSEAVLDQAQKSMSLDATRELREAMRAADISLIANFMVGLKGDSHESMRATLDFAKDLCPEFLNIYAAQAYPGSQLFNETAPEDLPESWDGYSQHSFTTKPLRTETLSAAEVLRFRDAAFLEFYSDERYLAYIGERFGSEAVEQIKRMAAVELPRKLLAA